MRALKIAGIVVGSVIGLVVLAALALVLLIDPNDYRGDLAQLVQRNTGRPLEIRGKLGLKLFPWIALELNDVRLGNPPGYGSDPFLSLTSASVGVKLLPLLHKRVEVRRVSIDGLSVTLVSRSPEQNNWKDLSESRQPAPAEAPGGTAKTSIAGVDVSKSTLIYRDESKKTVARLTGLEIHTGALGGSDPVDAEVKFDYEAGDYEAGGPAKVAYVETKARILMPPDSSRIEVRELDAKADWFGKPAEGSQPASKPLAIAVSSPSLALDTKAGTLAPTTLDLKLGDLPVKVDAQGEKLFSAYVVNGRIQMPKASPRELMKSFDIEPPTTSDPKALSTVAFASNFRLTEKQLQLSALDMTLDETTVKGTFGIEDLEAMALRFDLDVNGIDLDRYMAPKKEEAKTAGGSAPAAVNAAVPPTEIPKEMLRSLNMQGKLRVGRAKVADLQFADVRLPVEATDGRTHLGPTQAKLFGGTYDGNIVLDAKPAQATLSLDEHVRSVDIGALMKAGFKTTRVVGKGNASAKLNATGNTDQAMFKTLAGRIDFDVKDGAVTGADLWYELRRAVAFFKRQELPTRPAGEPKTAFNALSGSALVDKGVLRNDDLLVDMSYLRAKGKGMLALASQAVDYRPVTEIYKLPEGDASMADLKAAEIPVTITGTLADMKVRPDVEGYLRSRFKKEVDKKVDEKKDELRKKLGDKLKGILGH